MEPQQPQPSQSQSAAPLTRYDLKTMASILGDLGVNITEKELTKPTV